MYLRELTMSISNDLYPNASLPLERKDSGVPLTEGVKEDFRYVNELLKLNKELPF